ncbi:MAG: hypothetical protein B6U65_01480 [Candidatus Wolframiiraptor sp. EX4484-121]|nr:MAG: hypothetical protein B6U65_01480 [Candidatus Wolframiiraptor sp. EX4484-121]
MNERAGIEFSFKHYLREDVASEITKFCRGRWVALESVSRRGRRIFHRYWDNERPLTISSPVDVKRILNRFRYSVPRTFYASANIYGRLKGKEDLRRDNILYSTPSWDIDGSLNEVDLIKEAARILIEELRRHEVERSFYLIWSGRGIHLHLNERAISDKFWETDPLRISFSIVEYVLREVRDDLMKLCERSKDPERRLKLENIMDVQRVFTTPLSLHRELDLVAVTIDPEKLDEFDLSWADPRNFRYWRDWDRYSEGEADRLAERALEAVKDENRLSITLEQREGRGRGLPIRSVGRFQVMALVQAARYYVLKGDLEKAKSFGLNRAIFYAWAKHRGVGGRRIKTAREKISEKPKKGVIEEYIGDEVAFKSKDGWFMIGGQAQRPTDFDRQVTVRFGKAFEKYWEAAVKYVKSFPRETLESQREFYKRVYLPIRDRIDKLLSA